MLKLLTWNCQGAFRKKYPLIAEMQPDLAVIQECEHPERIPWKKGKPPTTILWFGEKPSKGLGIFSWTGLEMAPLETYDTTIRYCIPLRVTAPYQFNVIAVWAMDHRMSAHSYSGQVYQAIAAYRDLILSGDTVFLGDYNSSPVTTPKSRLGNHASVSMNLHDLWLVSAYHQYFFEKQGQEKRWTYFQHRRADRRWHIDFAYIPSRWTRRLAKVEVGEPQVWLEHSDHCPIMVDIQEKGPGVIA
jgi:exodeoxyribonuclease III